MAEGKPGTFQSEGDINLAPERRDWAEFHIDAETRALLDEDERYFFRQSLSTPCLNALQGASGSYLIDSQGRRILDFHGNACLLYTSPSPRDRTRSRMPSSA